MKQILYTLENIKKIYLCAYTNAYISNGHLFMVNTLTNKQVAISGKEEDIHEILNYLLIGIKEEKLLDTLSEMGVEDTYELLIREGMIE